MGYLKSLDIGHGYTADGGQTFPLRGQGVGLMPELADVLQAFPEGRFLVNFKSREAREGDMLAERLRRHPEWRPAIWAAYGGGEPTSRAVELIPGLRGYSRRGLVDCLLKYLGLGWTGFVPESCRDTLVSVPINAAPWLWGWPNRFLERLRSVGSEVILLGPYSGGDPGTAGIDTLEQLAQVPASLDGYIWTNRVELLGPVVKAQP